MFTAAKNDAFVGAESWVRVRDLFAAAGGGEVQEKKWRLLVVPNAYPKTSEIKKVSLLVWGPQKKKAQNVIGS